MDLPIAHEFVLIDKSCKQGGIGPSPGGPTGGPGRVASIPTATAGLQSRRLRRRLKPARRLEPAPRGCVDNGAAARPQNTTRSASWMMRGNCDTPLTDPNAVLVGDVLGALN